MSNIDRIYDKYYEWLMNKIQGFGKGYSLLLKRLYDTEFTYSFSMDENRYEDGISLRYYFCDDENYGEAYKYMTEPCSVLEMMIALASRCEADIMDSPDTGDKTYIWFWRMIDSLHLDNMDDAYYDDSYVDKRLSIFLNRQYRLNGDGGLFTIRNCERDLRKVEIWQQACLYFNHILFETEQIF